MAKEKKEKKEKLVLKKDMTNEEKLVVIGKMIKEAEEKVIQLKQDYINAKKEVENLKDKEKGIKYDIAFPEKENKDK